VPFVRKKFRVKFNSIIPDDVKERLPEYEGWNADALHEESSDLAEREMARHAIARRHNLIYDIVGRTEAKVIEAITNFDQLGYRVVLMLTDLPSWKAAGRVWDRFQENPFQRIRSKPPGRFVLPHYVHYEVGKNPRTTFENLKNHESVSAYCRLDVDVPRGSPAKIAERKGM
jgi:hypothetical protein